MFNFWPFNIARKRREAFEAYEAQRPARRRAELESMRAAQRSMSDHTIAEFKRRADALPHAIAGQRPPARNPSAAKQAPAPSLTPAADNSYNLFSPGNPLNPIYHSSPSPAPSSYACSPSPSYDSGSSYSSDCGSSSSDSGSSSCGCD